MAEGKWITRTVITCRTQDDAAELARLMRAKHRAIQGRGPTPIERRFIDVIVTLALHDDYAQDTLSAIYWALGRLWDDLWPDDRPKPTGSVNVKAGWKRIEQR